ncbi:MAG: ABC transporter permease subunit [Bacillota bacterium]|nr:ABC transporter permease subunit [Bacillota bacterium]
MYNIFVKKYLNTILFIFIGLLLWQVSAQMIHNPFILPTPIKVLFKMVDQLFSYNFFSTVGLTIYRTLCSVLISFVLGLGTSLLVLKQPKFEILIKKAILCIQSIPNVTLIILFMFWFSKEFIVYIVSFLLLFPVVYQNIIHTLKEIDSQWKSVFRVYEQSKSVLINKIYIPLLKPVFVGTLSSCISMGFKVGVMAEILSQVHNGIGRSMQLARLDVDLAAVIAWTLWLFICVTICERIVQKIIQWIC